MRSNRTIIVDNSISLCYNIYIIRKLIAGNVEKEH